MHTDPVIYLVFNRRARRKGRKANIAIVEKIVVTLCVKSMIIPMNSGPTITPTFKHVFKIPYPKPILLLSRISAGKAKVVGGMSAAIKPRNAILRNRIIPEKAGMKKSETVIPKADIMINVLRFPNLSETKPVRGVMSAPIISKLDKKFECVEGMDQ